MCATRKRLTSLSRALLCDRQGATALEFALVAPVLLTLVFGTIEMGLTMLAQDVMESASFAASRLGKTGYSETGDFEDQAAREVAMRTILNSRMGVLLTADKVSITTRAYNQFDQIGQPEPFIDANGNGVRDDGENYTDVNLNGSYDSDMGAAGLGNARQVVVYTISYPWRITTPFIGKLLSPDGILHLTARTVVQNEPY